MTSPNAPLCVVIPMKDPDQAKTRLGDTLPAKTRAALTRTLFRQTLRVLKSLDQGLHIVVVTDSDAIAEICLPFRVQVLADPGGGLNEAVKAGADYAAHHRFASVCILPGDLADPSRNDLAALLAMPREVNSAIIAPAHDGGTNALLVTPPDAMRFAYGTDSCAAHQAQAENAGLSCLVMPLTSLLYDVDRSSDLGARLARGLDRSLGAFAKGGGQ
ncbi:MAG: 2-phospho-L-lactate guanylyltransferase [Hyphomicrobiales bacterium]